MVSVTFADLLKFSQIDYLHPCGFSISRRSLELIGVDAHRYFLDVGSGKGATAIYAASEFGTMTLGVEKDPFLVKLARKTSIDKNMLKMAEFRFQDFTDTNFQDGLFDGALLENVLSTTAKWEIMLTETLRVTKRGNVVLHDYFVEDALAPKDLAVLKQVLGVKTLLTLKDLKKLLSAHKKNNLVIEDWSGVDNFKKIIEQRNASRLIDIFDFKQKLLLVAKFLITNPFIIFKIKKSMQTIETYLATGKLKYYLVKVA
ncbi:MAG: class I SAM-dependent methyltransferase [Candidatus Woesearchaeota archaeon]|nr:MAG: class I SAM-dependent methyltransferase [Candidatus Woesearchaeota archaeon]